MYKFIGTEQQLLDLGFEKLSEYGESFWQTNDEISDYCAIDICDISKKVQIVIGNGDYTPQEILKLFVSMVERGLIVWEE